MDCPCRAKCGSGVRCTTVSTSQRQPDERQCKFVDYRLLIDLCGFDLEQAVAQASSALRQTSLEPSYVERRVAVKSRGGTRKLIETASCFPLKSVEGTIARPLCLNIDTR
jgi:hypothetical protein